MRLLCRWKLQRFGSGSEIRVGSYLIECSNIFIGNDVVIRPQCLLMADSRKNGGQIRIGNKVLIGPGVHIYVNDHKFDNVSIPIYDQDHSDPSLDHSVILESGCWIGARAVILKGVVIGANSVVAAGSVVTRSVPPCTVVAGVPAKVIRWIT
jgi:acetyltransferase-like isoleucine patch superfamily enzyme